MGMPSGIPIVDTLIGFPHEVGHDFIRQQTKDRSSQEMEVPVEYMFKDAPKELPIADPLRSRCARWTASASRSA